MLPKNKTYNLSLLIGLLLFTSQGAWSQSVIKAYQDHPFVQEHSIKYYIDSLTQPRSVAMDRNGNIQVLTHKGLYKPHAGQFLYPGQLVEDRSYLAMKDKKVKAMEVYQEQFVYLDDKAVFSNAWAGGIYFLHGSNAVAQFVPGKEFEFLIYQGNTISKLGRDGVLWQQELDGELIDIHYGKDKGLFYALMKEGLLSIRDEDGAINRLLSGKGFTAFAIKGNEVVLGSNNGYKRFDIGSGKVGAQTSQVPWPEITAVQWIHDRLWFGSNKGAFMLKEDGSYNYYFGERWLTGDRVIDMAEGKDGSVLVLTDAGLSQLVFASHTLEEKAAFFEDQVRKRHIRLGFNSSLSLKERGNVDSGQLKDSDNDGLWTAMYLASQAFRYAVNGDTEALQNCQESLEAMERLYLINPVEGFPSRSYNRSGYKEQLADPERWQSSADPEWDWKATTSSDEAIGHVFVLGVIAELVEDSAMRDKAIGLLDALMSHIVQHDMYLTDYDGKPTLWGKWNPEYVNNFPKMVGDRKLNSSNIIAMLQTAYHFTQKEIFKDKAYELMENYGYLDNLMVPMETIGKAEEGGDDWAAMLSEAWNHSDDEMYFLGYWGLYRYAFTEELKSKYAEAISDHWKSETAEKDGLWNIITAIASPGDFGQEDAVWYLQEYPMDLINWTMTNSHRKDLQFLAPNFREQSTSQVLAPDELMIRRHNANRFTLDGGNKGMAESSAGDIWLLPYWMGRYLGVISEAKK